MDKVSIDKNLETNMVRWRRRLHMYPELSFREIETSNFVAEILQTIPQMQVERNAGYETAVVGTISNGCGPVIALRADMDALPIQEKNAHDYRSKHDGVMHACGHDAHTAIALGTAMKIGELFRREKWQGTVKFIFQPAEEAADDNGSTGAPYMVKAGVLNDVDQVLALHMSPENGIGQVKIHDGYSMANVDVFHADIEGTGGHGAYPHRGTDPIWMLGQVMQGIYAIPSRKISPLTPGVISIGKLAGGTASNIIPSSVSVSGTIRSYDPVVRAQLHQELKKVFTMVEPLGFSHRLKIVPEDPALKNDPAVNNMFRKVIADIYPNFELLNEPFGLGGEDFAHMTKEIPGAMLFLGCSLKDGVDRDLHTPYFDIDEQALVVGATVMTNTVVRFLNKKGN